MHASTLLTLALTTLAAASPSNWTQPTIYAYSNATSSTSGSYVKPTKSSLVTVTRWGAGYAQPTSGVSVSKSSAFPVFTGAAAPVQKREMVGLVLAVGGGMVLLV
jgi:hypothetical protein